MIRKATETKLKKYWYCLLGKELYVYKNKQEEKHKGMHNLVGVFIKDEPEEYLDSTTVLYPFSLIFPGNKPRVYYLLNKEDKEKWMNAIKKVIGYSNLFDYYDIKETLGKGKFGLVKAAQHKKTGKKVAVKVMSKKEMTVQDVELQRREIEILKMCQHPYIIRLLDIFENQDYIYIVMENLSGGDLFTYLEKRNFEISERRAKELSHQIATALYYLHSFGVAHRDLKPENILMNEEGVVKICDFGSAKLLDGKLNTPYIVSRYYRAPELILACSDYSEKIDVWAIGCIFTEFLTLRPLFPGKTEGSQLIEQVAILGLPSRETLRSMSSQLSGSMIELVHKLDEMEPRDIRTLLPFKDYSKKDIEESADLISKMVRWVPSERLSCEEALKHPFFKGVKVPQ